jgi:hypothetical protein
MVGFELTTSLSRIPSYTTKLLHQLCLYYVFILMYYNKSRVIWLFKALNEFIWKCDQL